MKKIIVILLLLTNKCYSQVIVNNGLNKFVGTWRWVSANDTFEITLHKQNYRNRLEIIAGWHKYVKDGILIQSSYQYIGRNINIDSSENDNVDFKTTISGSTYATKPTKLVLIRAWDFCKRQNNGGFLELLPNSLTQARWRLTHYSGKSYGLSPILFKLPRDIILTKL